VNFLPLAERRRYVAEMVDHAVRKGVKFDKPAWCHAVSRLPA
jgi:hypothetical protein